MPVNFINFRRRNIIPPRGAIIDTDERAGGWQRKFTERFALRVTARWHVDSFIIGNAPYLETEIDRCRSIFPRT